MWQALKVFFPARVDKTISRDFCVRPYFIFIRTYDSSCFMHGAQPVGARTADNFRTLCADGSTDDRNRQQQQECREYQLAAMLHDVLYLLTVALSDPGIRHRG